MDNPELKPDIAEEEPKNQNPIEPQKEKEKDRNKKDKKDEAQKEKDKKEKKKKEDEKKLDKDKEKKEDDKKEKKRKKDDKKQDIFLYFIEFPPADYSLNLELVENKCAKDLEEVKNDSLEYEGNSKYIIYKLKITPPSGNKSTTIKFKLKDPDNKDNNFKSEIELKDYSNDLFYYDFNYLPEKSHKKDKKLPGQILPHLQQFKIYLNYIEEDFEEEKKPSGISNLILSTKNSLKIKYKKKEKEKGEEEYYDLSLFFSVFISCYKNPIISVLLSEFELGNVNINNGSLKLSSVEIDNMKKNFDDLEKESEIILKSIEADEKEKLKYKTRLYFIIISFRTLIDREKLKESLNNILGKEDIKKNIYKGIVKNHELFEGIKFEKEQISCMVKASESFRRIKRSLSFNVNTLDYLEIFLENFDYIISVRNEELKKEKGKKPEELILEIESNMVKETDDVKKVCEVYEKICEKQQEKGIEKLLIFSHKLFDKYIRYLHGKNLENLFCLKNLLKKIIKNINRKITSQKEQNKTKKTKKDPEEEILSKYKESEKKLQETIHLTGIILSSEGNLTNMQIMNFIKEDKDYIKYLPKDQLGHASKIIKGINISLINNEFIKEFKNFDWHHYFQGEEKYIFRKIIDSVVDLKNFGTLMKLLSNSKKENELKFDSQSIDNLQEKFINNWKEENDFINDLVELLYFSDRDNNHYRIINFLHDKMNFDMVKNIYIKLCNKYQEKLSEESKSMIMTYFFNNSEDTKHNILFEFSKNFKFMRKSIFNNMYENDKIKLFKGLLENSDITNNEYKYIDYVKNSLTVINQLKENFDKNEIKYLEINNFCEKDKMDILSIYLQLIYLNDSIKANEKLNELLDKLEKIKNVDRDLDIIYKDFQNFFYISRKKEIEDINNIKTNIIGGTLNNYERNYSGK